MTHRNSLPLSQIQYYATAVYPCSYLEGRIARSQVAGPNDHIDTQVYSDLVQQGFRRSGAYVYRPHCDHCQACTSIRVLASEFRPNRSQRRAHAQHQDLIVHTSELRFSEEHYALYQRYQKARHPGGGMDHDDVAQYIEFLVNTHVNSFMVEFREAGSKVAPNQLRMVSIIDQLNDGLSAVYTFYEPLIGQNFGTYNVLWQIASAQTLGLNHVYLGYWIETCQKMSYKTRFQPCELLMDTQWIRAHSDSPAVAKFFTR